MEMKVEIDREVDGRWIADIPDLPGVMVYGADREEAVAKVKALALRVLADRVDRKDAAAIIE
jgi:predicted RNase H-like HicB family nuclease